MFRAFAAILVAASALSLFIALWHAMHEQRYDLAVMRTLGATGDASSGSFSPRARCSARSAPDSGSRSATRPGGPRRASAPSAAAASGQPERKHDEADQGGEEHGAEPRPIIPVAPTSTTAAVAAAQHRHLPPQEPGVHLHRADHAGEAEDERHVGDVRAEHVADGEPAGSVEARDQAHDELGAEVPKATTVAPTITGDSPKWTARFAAPGPAATRRGARSRAPPR